MKQLTSIDDLHPDPQNPRKISAESASGLGYSLEEFGDLSGIVWNSRTGQLVCGHQRLAQLKSLGAVLHGQALRVGTDGSKIFGIRIVDWPASKQRAANVAANNQYIQGEFTDELQLQLPELKLSLGDVDYGKLQLGKLELAEKSGSRQDWRTDEALFQVLSDVFGPFELDVCASDEWHLCDQYFTEENSALENEWPDVQAFCNPPFGDAGPFIAKLADHADRIGKTCVALCLASVSSAWFHAAASRGTLLFPSKRVSYWHPTEDGGGFNRDSALFVFGPQYGPGGARGVSGWVAHGVDVYNEEALRGLL